jgi:hypothetical protein
VGIKEDKSGPARLLIKTQIASSTLLDEKCLAREGVANPWFVRPAAEAERRARVGGIDAGRGGSFSAFIGR